uniref:Uncharacterized protein n=1 Tax=Agrobacterium tumefaciens TaxID=358 RepID=K7WT04_AGRTU|nr:Hypothetical protein [Agrobacterium radiobacter]
MIFARRSAGRKSSSWAISLSFKRALAFLNAMAVYYARNRIDERFL